jgi:hypothetical protein
MKVGKVNGITIPCILYNYGSQPHEDTQEPPKGAEDDSSKGEGLLLEEDEDPGTKEICRAVMNSRHQTGSKRSYATKRVEVKLGCNLNY